jgi:hypothetical protein
MIDPEQVQAPFETKTIDTDGMQMTLPYLRVQSQDGEIILHPFNTRVRLIQEPPGLDHVEYRDDTGTKGITMPEEIIGLFEEYNFDVHWSLRADKNTVEWLSNVAMRNIDEELVDLLGGATE